MDNKSFADLVGRAEKDPKFLHNLLFRPETMVAELSSSIGRKGIGALVSRQPAELVAIALGIDSYCGNTCTSSCDNTCGGSCGYTTNLVEREMEAVQPYFSRRKGALEGCGNTCTSSCDNTCGGSCGFTTNLTDFQRFGQQSQFFR